MTAPAHAVSIRGLHVVFPVHFGRPVHAVRGVDLDVESGSILGLLGPNGCGKTTTLACLLGLLHPLAGTIRIHDREVGGDRFDPEERPYGVLLEDTRLPPFLSVREALRTTAALRGLRAGALAAELERVTELCGIAALHARRVGVLSKGQARRVGLAAALVGDPPLLVLDEPSAGLDVSARVEFEELLRRLRDGRRTVLVASHFLGDVQNTCTHVAVMRDGCILAAGTTGELVTRRNGRSAGSDVYVDEADTVRLAQPGVTTAASRYRGLVRVVSAEADEALLRRLLDLGVVPRRMEPRETLLSAYLELTESGEVS